MDLYFDCRNIIREYILYHAKDIYFRKVYYFLIDYESKKILNYFDTGLLCTEYSQLIDESECFTNDFLRTFEPACLHFDENTQNSSSDKLRIMEKTFLSKAELSSNEMQIADFKTLYRFILTSYTIYGLKHKQQKLWFTDQDWITYHIGNKLTQKAEYSMNNCISPEMVGSSCRKFWYDSNISLMQMLKKLSFDFNLLL